MKKNPQHEEQSFDQVLRILDEVELRLSKIKNWAYLPNRPDFDHEPIIEKYKSISDTDDGEWIEWQLVAFIQCLLFCRSEIRPMNLQLTPQ